VGKAKSLSARVASYFRGQQHGDWKVQALMGEYEKLEHIVTRSETEALFLEAQLVREHQPKYNVLLKSGNPFIYVLITDEELPTFKLVRLKREKGTYFGPFLHKGQVRSGFDFLVRTFKLGLCAARIAEGCLNYHLGRCAGNCRTDFNKEEYCTRVKLAEDALRGRHKDFLATIERRIAYHNEQLEFEVSRNLGEYLKNLDLIFDTLKTKFSEKKYEKEIDQVTLSFKRPIYAFAQALSELKKLLGMSKLPSIIDCFDISHFQSTHIVGSCVRFVDGIVNKSGLRRFKIKSLVQQNDYAALQEIVMRRYKNAADIPDVVIIDGGKGQLSAVQTLLPGVLCIALAKQEERLFTPLHPRGVVLDSKTDLGQLIIALRDYAHHFALEYHRLLRNKRAI
jgi:excinuclease ABC subunit C